MLIVAIHCRFFTTGQAPESLWNLRRLQRSIAAAVVENYLSPSPAVRRLGFSFLDFSLVLNISLLSTCHMMVNVQEYL
jgi:hypothetical protein